jgi:hypothetical protein
MLKINGGLPILPTIPPMTIGLPAKDLLGGLATVLFTFVVVFAILSFDILNSCIVVISWQSVMGAFVK